MNKVTATKILTFLIESRRQHYHCDDSWYSCPKHPEGCSDGEQGSDCSCGADAYNEKLDEIIKLVEKEIEKL